MWSGEPKSISTREYEDAERLREKNAVKAGTVGIGCGAGFAAGALLITTPAGIPILVGTGVACGAVALGYSEPVPQPYYGTAVYNPYARTTAVYRPPVFLYASETSLRGELSRELGRRGWRITEAETWPPGAMFAAAIRKPGGVLVEIYGENGWGKMALEPSLPAALSNALKQAGLE